MQGEMQILLPAEDKKEVVDMMKVIMEMTEQERREFRTLLMHFKLFGEMQKNMQKPIGAA